MAEQTEARTDTRARIKEVALELFTEQGYDATSLREIAERLGVTKAALYYHFKSKEEIVESFSADHVAKIESLVAWGHSLPPTPESRQQFIRRYADELQTGRHHEIMRFFHQNQPAVRHTHSGGKMKDSLLSIAGFLAGEDATPEGRLKAALAIMALHTSWLLLSDDSLTDDERRAVSLKVSLDLIA
jgi:AcrR family transcriptional regulator